MDANDLLRELRELAGTASTYAEWHRVAELFDELDAALSNGGEKPDAWVYGDAVADKLRERSDG